MKGSTIIIVFLVCWANISCAQYLDYKPKKKPFKPKFIFEVGNRNSFVEDGKGTTYPAIINGTKLGLQIMERFSFGMGFFGLTSDFEAKKIIEGNDTTTFGLEFKYSSLTLEYKFYKNSRIELAIPVHFGGGTSAISKVDKNGEYEQIRKKDILLIEAGIEADYKIKGWIGLGAGIGYREMLIDNDFIAGNFSSTVYYLKAKFYLGYLYKYFKSALKKPSLYKTKRIGSNKIKYWDDYVY